MIARQLEAAPARPKLRLVRAEDLPEPVSTRRDLVSRACRLERIRWLQRTYQLQFLVNQAAFGRDGLECLSDDELVELHRKLERARECVVEGISLEDADLIENMALR